MTEKVTLRQVTDLPMPLIYLASPEDLAQWSVSQLAWDLDQGRQSLTLSCFDTASLGFPLPQAAAPRGPGPSPAPPPEAPAKEAAEDIPQVAEVKATVETGSTGPSTIAGIHPGKAELVVAGLLIRVGEHLVGLVDLLELLLGLLVVRVQVRVVLPGHLLIGLFDLVLGRSLGDAQNLVVIAFLFCHRITNFSMRNVKLGMRNCGVRQRRTDLMAPSACGGFHNT